MTRAEAQVVEDSFAAIGPLTLEMGTNFYDNLFEIGTSSLTLIQIHERIDAEYPGLIDLTELFDFPTVEQLAAHLEGKRAAAKG